MSVREFLKMFRLVVRRKHVKWKIKDGEIRTVSRNECPLTFLSKREDLWGCLFTRPLGPRLGLNAKDTSAIMAAADYECGSLRRSLLRIVAPYVR